MANFEKAYWSTDGNSISVRMPISKVDQERRIVSGWATTDSLDKQGDIVNVEASTKAFEDFRGNVREQHTPLAVGKVVSFKQDKYFDKEADSFYNGIYVDVYVSKGAEDTWHKINEGILTGFSIGGSINDSEEMYNKQLDAPVRVIKDYDLYELSLVDNPANPASNIVSVQKFDHIEEEVMEKNYLENVYWCPTNDNVILSEKTDYSCPDCSKHMTNIGFVESNDVDKAATVRGLIDTFTKAENVSRGDFVSWNSSGGTARGRVTRVVRSGSVDVPGSSFTINAEEDNPAVLIRVYRQSGGEWQPTDTIVGHKMSTLRRISPLTKVSDSQDDLDEAIDEDLAKSIADNNEKEGSNVGILNRKSSEETAEVEKSEDVAAEIVEEAVEEATETVEKSEDAADEVAEETAEEIVEKAEEAEAVTEEVEKSTTPNEEDSTDDLAKAVSEIKDSVADSMGDLAAVVKGIADQVAEMKKSLDGVQEEVTVVKGNVEEFGERVDAVEADTAVRKSGDLGGIVQEEKTEKSMWGGRFLKSADLYR